MSDATRKMRNTNRSGLAQQLAEMMCLETQEVLEVLIDIDDESFIECAPNEAISEFLEDQGYDVAAPEHLA